MRYGRVEHGGRARWARFDGERAILLDRAPWDGGEADGETTGARRLAPVAPSKIVCVGRNYRAHAEELGNEVPAEPLLFLKPPSTLLASGDDVVWPAASERVDFEGEVAAVIARPMRDVTPEAAAAGVFGLTCANDVTARDLQRADVQFTRGKGFDTFCPVGPWIETETPALDAVVLRTRVDGELRQQGRTAQMVWGIAALISYISGVMTLEPGDLVLTGTPEGVGPLSPGQQVEVEIEGVGTLVHGVRTSP
ncbi:MAG: fumarylacetoacetate hydrolase family protein [Myxococcota bacterium]|nr:fumarylacetoacetate hydrolase family protein [Myxococcota bacterium]